MGFNKIVLQGEQNCDLLYVQSSDGSVTFDKVDSDVSEWDNDTLLFAKFDGNLSAGNTSFDGGVIGYEIRRKKGASFYTEYVGKTTGNDVKFVVDYAAENRTSYSYFLYPFYSNDYGRNILLAPQESEEIRPNWNYWSLLVVDESEEENVFYLNKLFRFEYGVSTDDMNNNAGVTVNQNFTKHPTVQYSPSNYWSGGLSALCGYVSCDKQDYIQTPKMEDELKALTTDTRRKFLKDISGHIWEVKISAPISISTNDATFDQIKTVKISWVEVGSAKGVSIINNPKAPTTEWLLTETGDIVPYIDYVWDNDYAWDNARVWTAKDDMLKNKDSNMGRDLTEQEVTT